MHRQSLGSPSSKLYNNGGSKEEEVEPAKIHRFYFPLPTPHTFLHLIPILTLLCFFFLYLSSHPPSPSDLDQFTRLRHHHLDSTMEISENIEQHYMDEKIGDVFALRNLPNLQQIRLHRKLAEF
ncbi:hypothetical protein TanjilG_16055 [Lupinus angustifolius]|uniref:Uncharacterized protein n=1 Tax=Lupinus angustifolius TaxID=3871 RepID=A0A4P1RGU5_LUPAN|nr:PREDICTED: uncharacterized protein LOC109349113 isoform X2 [Lupinus angustifolius]OIW10683.1 hypothetical protein TanjilG_16055 [Lupinus angustifolius]